MENWSTKDKDVKQGKCLNIVEPSFKFNQISYSVVGVFFLELIETSINYLHHHILIFHCFLFYLNLTMFFFRVIIFCGAGSISHKDLSSEYWQGMCLLSWFLLPLPPTCCSLVIDGMIFCNLAWEDMPWYSERQMESSSTDTNCTFEVLYL